MPRIAGFADGSGCSTANSRAITRSTFPSTTVSRLVKGDGRNGRCRIRSDAGERAQGRLGRRKTIASHGLGAGIKISRPRVIAKPRPGRENLVARCGRQRFRARPSRHECLEIGNDGFDRGLLQHDLRKPDHVRIGRLARTRAPRKIAPRAVIPVEERALKICRGKVHGRSVLTRASRFGISPTPGPSSY